MHGLAGLPLAASRTALAHQQLRARPCRSPPQGPRSFFSEIISSINDIRFSPCGRYILSRDYMTLKLWDINMDSGPLASYPVHESLRGKVRRRGRWRRGDQGAQGAGGGACVLAGCSMWVCTRQLASVGGSSALHKACLCHASRAAAAQARTFSNMTAWAWQAGALQGQCLERWASTWVMEGTAGRAPLSTPPARPRLPPQLCDLYESDCIFDKFDCAMSGDGRYFASGTYSNFFRWGSGGSALLQEATALRLHTCTLIAG